jgi:predicted Zn finger-like uncharacterized protein
MKILCPQCRTAYELAPATLGSGGRSVRCARCQHVWFADAPKPADLGAGAEAAKPRPAFTIIPAETVPEPPAIAVVESPEPTPQAGAQPLDAQSADPSPDATPVADSAVAGDEIPQPAASASDPAEAPPAAPEFTSADIETIAARRAQGRRRPRKPARSTWRLSGLAAAIAALVAVDAGLVVWRTDVVRMLPQTASLFGYIGLPVNLRGLAFRNIHTAYEDQDGMNILVVDGTIVASGHSVVDVPRLRFAIEAGNGHEIYAWTALPTRTKLAPGESLPFRSRLASPPEQGRSMKVRFFNRQDFASGLR